MRRILLFILITMAAGPLLSQNISGIVNVYRKVLWADSASGRIKLSDVTGFASYAGYKAMIVQMKGTTMDETNAATFGNISAINNAGYYEVGTICGFQNDTVIMERKLNNKYDTFGKVQFVIIPKYTNVTVTDTIKAQPWDSTAGTGGIIAIDVSGTLTLSKPIDASGAGFKGGNWLQFGNTCTAVIAGGGPSNYYFPYAANSATNGAKKGEGITAHISSKEYGRGKQTNGGGGGNNHNGGGAGGGNYSAGGKGGTTSAANVFQCNSVNQAEGGLALNTVGYSLSTSTQNRIFLGGGGGAGHENDGYGMPGGAGGGIIYITANSIAAASGLASDNKIMANGESGMRFLPAPYNVYTKDAASDGSGGGGAGGVVIIKSNSYSGSLTVEAKGADGGGTETGGSTQCKGPGGGGGGGVIWFSQSSTPASVTTNVTGGVNGTTSATASCPNSANSATSGSAGATLFNFALAAPKDSSPICKQILPIKFIISLSGYRNSSNENNIRFTITNADMMYAAALQASSNGIDFYDIKSWNNRLPVYSFTEKNAPADAYYRVKVQSITGSFSYSAILHLSNNFTEGLKVLIQPNPVQNFLSAQITIPENTAAEFYITDVMGNKIITGKIYLLSGNNVYNTGTDNIPAGVYYLHVNTARDRLAQRFVKLP